MNNTEEGLRNIKYVVRSFNGLVIRILEGNEI